MVRFERVVADLPDRFLGIPTNLLDKFPGLSNIQTTLSGTQDNSLIHSLQLPFNGDTNTTAQQLKDYCMTNANLSVYNEIEETMRNLPLCASRAAPKLSALLTQSQDKLCHNTHSTVRGCLLELTSKLELCMDTVSQYLPKILVESFDSTFEFLCKDEADHATTLFMALNEHNGCLQKVQEGATRCFRDTKQLTYVTDVFNMTKPELCNDISTWKDCIVKHADENCSKDMYKNELMVGIANALFFPCSGCNSFVQSTVFYTTAFVFVLLRLF